MSCCTPNTSTAADIRKGVKEYYGQDLQSSADLKTNACTTSERPPQVVINALKRVPAEVMEKFYGCGNPIPLGIEGLDVLDLGSGSGRDCYVAAQLVGPNGSVTGIDMTEEQLEVARKHADDFCIHELKYPKPNLKFVNGLIEDLRSAGIEDASQDIVISNCVINLSPDKPSVLKAVYNVLREGGEFYFSDVYCDRRLPTNVQTHKVLVGECIGGAMYIEDFKKTCVTVGFSQPLQVSKTIMVVNDPKLKALVGNANFYSITYRVFKSNSTVQKYVRYLGTISDYKTEYKLDITSSFRKDAPVLVGGNTLALLTNSRLKSHFEVVEGELLESLIEQAAPGFKDSPVPCASSKSTAPCCGAVSNKTSCGSSGPSKKSS